MPSLGSKIPFLIRQNSLPIFISKDTTIMSMPKSPSPDIRRRPTILHTQICSKPRRHLTTSMPGISTSRIQTRAMVRKNHDPSMRLVTSHLGNLRVEAKLDPPDGPRYGHPWSSEGYP